MEGKDGGWVVGMLGKPVRPVNDVDRCVTDDTLVVALVDHAAALHAPSVAGEYHRLGRRGRLWWQLMRRSQRPSRTGTLDLALR